MPQVPVYGAPQVAPRPVATPYSNPSIPVAGPESFGAAMGPALQQAGQELGRVYQEEKQKADQFRAAKEDAGFGADINGLLYGSDNAPGFLTQQGENALDIKPLGDALQKAKQKRLDSLANDDQRRDFELRAMHRLQSAMGEAERHSAQQLKVVNAGVVDGQLQLARDTAALDPTKAEDAYKKVLVNPDGTPGPFVRHLKDDLGLPPEEISARVQAEGAKVYGAAIQGLIDSGNGIEAQRFFESHRADLGVEGLKYEGQFKQLATAQVAEHQAAGIVAGARVPGYAWVDSAKALDAVEKLQTADPLVKEKTRALVEHQVGKAQELQRQAGEQTFNHALSLLEQGVPLDSPAMAADRGRLLDPRNGWATHWHQLEQVARANAEHARNQPPTPEQEAAMTRFRVWAADHPDQARLMSTDTFNATWLPQFAKKDREQAGALLATYHQQLNKGSDQLTPLEDKFLLSMGREAGVFDPSQNDPSKWTPERSQLYYRAANELQGKIDDFKRTTGSMPKPDVVEGWTRDLFKTGRVPGTGLIFDATPTRLQYQTNPKYQGKPFIPEGTVRVALPDGTTGSVPKESLQNWLNAHPGGKAL